MSDDRTTDPENSDRRWLRAELLTARPDHDATVLAELDALGVEVQDAQTYMEGIEPAPIPDGKTRLIAFFDADESTAELRHRLDESLDDVEIISVSDYGDRSWETAWMDYFEAITLSPRIAVGPPWDSPDEPEDGIALIIEPGMAFGTGSHATTKLSAALLDEIMADHPVESVLDVGCGSGILSMAAAGLGARRVVGIDVDSTAVEAAETNIEQNGFSTDDIELSTRPLSSISARFDLVVANILAPVLLDLRALLQEVVADGGDLILSGISGEQLDDVRHHFDHPDFTEVEATSDDQWRALHLRRTDHHR